MTYKKLRTPACSWDSKLFSLLSESHPEDGLALEETFTQQKLHWSQ